MAKGKITINTDIATEVANGLKTIASSLEGDIIGKLSCFEPLVELGFISISLPKVKEQATSLSESENQIASSISSHIQDVVTSEDKLKGDYSDRTSGGGSYTSTSSASGSPIDVDETEEAKGFSKVKTILQSLSEENRIKLIRFVNFYKDSGLSLAELLFNKKRSKDLYVLLKKALSESVDLGELTLDEMQQVQKLVVNMIMTGKTEFKELNDSSIIACKEHLNNVAKKYQTDVGSLILDKKDSSTYKTALTDMYNGNVEKNVKDSDITKFRSNVDSLASKNNMSSYQLIIDKTEVIL